MASISVTNKSRGRPRADTERVVVRLPAALLALVDAEATLAKVGRPEAVRRLLMRIPTAPVDLFKEAARHKAEIKRREKPTVFDIGDD